MSSEGSSGTFWSPCSACVNRRRRSLVKVDEVERLPLVEIDVVGFLILRLTERTADVNRLVNIVGRIYDARKLDRVASPRKTDKKKLCGKNESPP